jgi:hypothetical protein
METGCARPWCGYAGTITALAVAARCTCNEHDAQAKHSWCDCRTPRQPSERRHAAVLTFPPVPLATGQVIRESSGLEHRVATVEIIVTTTDGTRRTVPVDARHGQWWPTAMQ